MSKDGNTVEMFYGASPILFEFAKRLRNNETDAEKLLWEKLRLNQLSGLRFKRQHPILYFIADFYCHKAKLVVEVDGGIHQLPAQIKSDMNRDAELRELGLTVIRFTNKDVFNRIDWVLEKIKEALPPQ
jgi:cyclase